MERGKFTQPRANSPEELEIEEAFLQVTGQKPATAPQPRQPDPLPEDYDFSELIREEPPVQDFEEEYDDSPTFMERLAEFISKNKKVVLVCACSVTLALILGIVSVLLFVSASDPYDGRILNNVVLAGINVGGMTRSEAEAAISAVTAGTYTGTDMVVLLPEETLTLSPENTGAQLDVKAAVKAAYSYGRTGSKAQKEADYQASLVSNHTIGLLPYLKLDEEYIRGTLEAYAGQYDTILAQPSYTLEGDRPALGYQEFDENAPTQTLVLTLGMPGTMLDIESVMVQILDAYSFHIFQVKVSEPTPHTLPQEPDLDAIYSEICSPAVNATMNLQDFSVIPGSYGYEFDLERARQQLKFAKYGDTLTFPMVYVAPEVLDDKLFFQDVLGEYKTAHTASENRNTNLRLACEAINGLVLNPGDEFSYNNTLGERTAEKGYKPAPAYSGNETVDSIGGGICQGSSTLYYAVLLADLDVVFRVNHSFVSSYIPYGLDATVSWGYPDFQFRNSSNFPIQIQAEMADGYVTMRILGTEERDYYVKMEYAVTGVHNYDTEYVEFEPDNEKGYKDGDVIRKGVTGYSVKTYKCKYNRETDELISRDFEANSTYKTVNQQVASVKVPEESKPTEPAPTEPKPTEPAPTEPKPTEPAPTEPKPTEPAPTEPKPTEPAPTEPAPTEATQPATEPAPAETAPPATEPVQSAAETAPAETAPPTTEATLPPQ